MTCLIGNCVHNLYLIPSHLSMVLHRQGMWQDSVFYQQRQSSLQAFPQLKLCPSIEHMLSQVRSFSGSVKCNEGVALQVLPHTNDRSGWLQSCSCDNIPYAQKVFFMAWYGARLRLHLSAVDSAHHWSTCLREMEAHSFFTVYQKSDMSCDSFGVLIVIEVGRLWLFLRRNRSFWISCENVWYFVKVGNTMCSVTYMHWNRTCKLVTADLVPLPSIPGWSGVLWFLPHNILFPRSFLGYCMPEEIEQS